MSIFKNTDNLRKRESKLCKKMESVDYDSKEYLKYDLKRLKLIDKICKKERGYLPRREHGWYLSSDD